MEVICSQHCEYWWPCAWALGHQNSQCWVRIHMFPTVNGIHFTVWSMQQPFTLLWKSYYSQHDYLSVSMHKYSPRPEHHRQNTTDLYDSDDKNPIRKRYLVPVPRTFSVRRLFNSSPLDKMAAILAHDNFKCIFLNENDRISIRISLKFVPLSPIDNKPALVQVMAWRRFGEKPLSESMVTRFTDAYMRHQGEIN